MIYEHFCKFAIEILNEAPKRNPNEKKKINKNEQALNANVC